MRPKIEHIIYNGKDCNIITLKSNRHWALFDVLFKVNDLTYSSGKIKISRLLMNEGPGWKNILLDMAEERIHKI